MAKQIIAFDYWRPYVKDDGLYWGRFVAHYLRGRRSITGLPFAFSQDKYALYFYVGPVSIMTVKSKYLRTPEGFAELVDIVEAENKRD